VIRISFQPHQRCSATRDYANQIPTTPRRHLRQSLISVISDDKIADRMIGHRHLSLHVERFSFHAKRFSMHSICLGHCLVNFEEGNNSLLPISYFRTTCCCSSPPTGTANTHGRHVDHVLLCTRCRNRSVGFDIDGKIRAFFCGLRKTCAVAVEFAITSRNQGVVEDRYNIGYGKFGEPNSCLRFRRSRRL